jgi:hypothetical protein
LTLIERVYKQLSYQAIISLAEPIIAAELGQIGSIVELLDLFECEPPEEFGGQ